MIRDAERPKEQLAMTKLCLQWALWELDQTRESLL